MDDDEFNFISMIIVGYRAPVEWFIDVLSHASRWITESDRKRSCGRMYLQQIVETLQLLHNSGAVDGVVLGYHS